MRKILAILFICFFANLTFAQDLKKIAEKNAISEKIPQKDVEKFVQNQISALSKIQSISKISQTLPPYTNEICDDGGFETKNFSQWGWTAAMNFRNSSSNANFSNYQPLSGFITSVNSGSTNFLWEIVSTGNDPLYSGLSKVHTGVKALKLGSSGVNFSAESIMKTVTIDASNANLSFWYALVLEDPGHGTGNPFFGVRIHTLSSVNFVPLLPTIGSMNTSPLVSDASSFWINSGTNRIRPWTCAKVDLSKYIGQQVTIEFLVSDCAAGAHFGYAYIDDICMGCKGSDLGDASISGMSKDCGSNAVVNGNYTLPNSPTNTGTLNSLQAQLYQNGIAVGTPIMIPSSSINTTLKTFSFSMLLFGTVASGNYDIVITGNFTFSGSSFSTSSPSYGFVAGINNDWQTDCPFNSALCCKNTLSLSSAATIPPSYPYNEGTYAVEKYNFTALSNAPITELKVEVISFEWLDGPEDCKQCQIKSTNLGSIFGGINIGGLMIPASIQPYGNGISTTSNNNEVVFSFSNGRNINSGDFLRLVYLLPPEKNLTCCETKAKVCRKITWKDINCGYCEVYDCSIVDLKSKSELPIGFTLPNITTLYLNSRDIFANGRAAGF